MAVSFKKPVKETGFGRCKFTWNPSCLDNGLVLFIGALKLTKRRQKELNHMVILYVEYIAKYVKVATKTNVDMIVSSKSDRGRITTVKCSANVYIE